MANQKAKFITIISTAVFLLTAYACQSGKAKTQENGIYNSFHPGELWLDSDSVHINAHGGGLLFHKDTYYWFGEHKIAGRGGNRAMVGVSCYSSTDLMNWKSQGTVLKVEKDTLSEITIGSVIERPKVIYNEKTGKFVMWFHLELKGQGYAAARTGLAVSDKVTGPYTYIKSYRPNSEIWPKNMKETSTDISAYGDLEWWTPQWRKAVDDGLFVKRDFGKGQMARDMTLFVDNDGTAYHVYSSEENLTIHIAELTPDYMDFTGKWTRLFPGGHNEAPALFKKDDTYFLITSGCTGWDPNAARSFKSSTIWGPWESLGNPCVGADSALTFHSQSTFVLPVQGKKDAFIFMADRWRPRNPIDGRYIWLPLRFENEKPILEFKEEWDLSVFD